MPLPPSAEPSEVAERLSRTSTDTSFITGNGFAAACRYVLNYSGFTVNEEVENDWYFCKVDYLDWFFEHHAPRSEFVLVSHNGDLAVGARHRRYLRRRGLRRWFATNVELQHPRLVPIPLGIANPGWEHGDPTALREAQAAALKTALFDVSFSIETNAAERAYCLRETGLQLAPRLPHRAYLARLAASYFCLAPSGNGIDTHRTWEALYLRAIPVVKKSQLTERHRDLPMVALEDWSEFGSVRFTPDLYEQIWGDWDPAALAMDAYVDGLRRELRESPAPRAA